MPILAVKQEISTNSVREYLIHHQLFSVFQFIKRFSQKSSKRFVVVFVERKTVLTTLLLSIHSSKIHEIVNTVRDRYP